MSVMFLVAVARPRPSEFFDGRVLVHPVVKYRTQKNNTELHDAGEDVPSPDKLNKLKFEDIILNHLVPRVKEIIKNRPSITKVTIQFDNASPHGGGRADITKMLKSLTKNPACVYNRRNADNTRTVLASLSRHMLILSELNSTLSPSRHGLLTSMRVIWVPSAHWHLGFAISYRFR